MIRAFSKSSPGSSLSAWDVTALVVAALAAAAIYLMLAARTYGIGFPLDDSWIHQSFARTLALEGEWALRPGMTASGSTAPLWSVLLAIGYALGLAPFGWSYVLGAAALVGIASLAEWFVRRQVQSYRPRLPWIGLFIVFEWHLLWAALSGMETGLHALILTTTLVLLTTGSDRYTLMGLLTGLSVWVRPDGVTLAGPVLLTLALTGGTASQRLRAAAKYCSAVIVLVALYVGFNLSLGGTPLPSTFYAKQAEYQVWQSMPLAAKLGQMAVQLFAGPGIVVVPGFALAAWQAARRRHWPTLCAVAWTIGYFALYIVRLPPYQHGRYLMPAMPTFQLLGLVGLVTFVRGARAGWQRLAGIAWTGSLVMLWLVFIGFGARSYANDVGLIETEMVRTAVWAATRLPPGALVAAHDIGALGYFDSHEVVDLAGLVSPEVIPFLRDEPELRAHLDRTGTDYLIAFPSLYPELTAGLDMVFTSGSQLSGSMGHDNLSIYRWPTAK